MLKIIQPVMGGLVTVQDKGRFGYQRYGVPVSGAMDQYAYRIANLLVGNQGYEACLEITMFGPTIEVLDDSVIAITGANLLPMLNDQPLPMWQSIKVKQGDIISFGIPQTGCRAYLALGSGIKNIPEVLGSRSTYIRRGLLGKGEIHHLQKDDVIEKGTTTEKYKERKVSDEFIPSYLVTRQKEIQLHIIMGPQDDYFSPEVINAFLSSLYQVTMHADRMGYRLEGPPIRHVGKAEIISDAVPLGAVQVPGDGMPIVLMAERQTTGGYPKIATVITVDTYKLSQARPGDRVRFSAVSINNAVSELKQLEDKIQLLESQL